MQLPVERPHECNESRDRADAGTFAESRKSAEAVLRANEAVGYIRAVLPRREQRDTEKVQEHGGKELWLSLKTGRKTRCADDTRPL